MQKVALITGCSSGIGLVSAVELAKAGFKVVATMRNPDAKSRLMEQAEKAGVAVRIDVRRLDICKSEELKPIVAEIIRDHGRVDVLVNNAGYALGGFAEDILIEELRAQLETNFFGHVNMTKAVLPYMRKQGSGHIIMISSIAGLVANPVLSSYASSKFALEGWTESLRIECKALGIKVVLVEPGAFDTDIWEKNVKVGAFAMSAEAPNHNRARRFSEVVKTKLRKGDTWIVGRLVAKIAQDSNPNLRYLVGKDAHVRFWLKRALPWKTYEGLISKFAGIDKLD
jgi:NAD(P)-dependent dehydrogenase (short-subunit alcohol dehydrogenase family)